MFVLNCVSSTTMRLKYTTYRVIACFPLSGTTADACDVSSLKVGIRDHLNMCKKCWRIQVCKWYIWTISKNIEINVDSVTKMTLNDVEILPSTVWYYMSHVWSSTHILLLTWSTCGPNKWPPNYTHGSASSHRNIADKSHPHEWHFFPQKYMCQPNTIGILSKCMLYVVQHAHHH